MRQRSLLIISVVCSIMSVGLSGAKSNSLPQPPERGPHGGTITATFEKDGFTLSITALCDRAGPMCPFRAEIHAAPALFQSIAFVEFATSPSRPGSRLRVTDPSSNFRLEAKQVFGEKVYADVTLRPAASAPVRVVELEGTIPFAASVSPPLPPGLRFEDQYYQQYLEGRPSDNYLVRIRLRGDAAALRRIRSVEYRLPLDYFSVPRVLAKAALEYIFDGSAPGSALFDIVAAIRWNEGTRSIHAIPFRPH